MDRTKKELLEELIASNKELAISKETNAKIERVFESAREFVANLCEIEGFITDETEEERIEREEKETKANRTTDSRLMRKIEELEAANVRLEKKIEDKEERDKKEELQKAKSRVFKVIEDAIENAIETIVNVAIE